MLSLRKRAQLAVDAATGVITDLGIRGPEDINVELIGAELRAYILWRELAGNEEGHLLHSGRSSIIHVRKSLHGTPKGSFVGAHEIGHHLLHAHVDHYALMCTSEAVAAGGTRFRIEGEASHFASELLVPTRFAGLMCRGDSSLEAVLAIARRFNVSFTVAALRFLDMTDAPCAFLEMRGDRVKRGSATASYRGNATRGHALVIPRDARRWSLPVEGTDVTLTWVTQG